MTPENFIKAKLADYAWAEAFDQGGVNGMLAVACVLRNRQRKGWWGGDWMAVINNAKDAAPYESTWPEPDLSRGDFRTVLQEIDDIYLGMYRDDLTGRDERDPKRKDGGLYYMNITAEGRTPRRWFEEKILADSKNHPRIAQVGMLYIFS